MGQRIFRGPRQKSTHAHTYLHRRAGCLEDPAAEVQEDRGREKGFNDHFLSLLFLFARGVVVRGVVMEFSSPAKREGLCTAAAPI